MTEIQRLPVPSLPNGSVRRKIPAPFTRPSITVGGGASPQERRDWKVVPARDIQTGDIIPGVGRVSDVHEDLQAPEFNSGRSWREVADAVSWTVTITGGLDNIRVYQGGETVWAFTAAATDG